MITEDYISGIRKELLSIEDNAKNIDGLTESQWVAIRAAHRLLGEYSDKLLHSLDTLESEKPMNSGDALDKEIAEYFPESAFCTGWNYDDMEDIARHFAKWQKEQILKEAVEGEYDSYPAAVYLDAPVPGIEHGDKVRVIVLPK